jgi:hypothetical protein
VAREGGGRENEEEEEMAEGRKEGREGTPKLSLFPGTPYKTPTWVPFRSASSSPSSLSTPSPWASRDSTSPR